MLKRIVFGLFCLISFSNLALSQTIVTTPDGKKVILNPDKTWEYLPDTKPAVKPTQTSESLLVITDESIPTTDIGADKFAGLEDIFKTPAQMFTGKVIDVHDGDTITLLDSKNEKYRVRFNGIDAPELKQDFGNRAQQHLAKIVAGKTATIVCPKIDKYRRWVCTVFFEGKDINLEQVKAGFAWHYKKYQSEQSESDRANYSAAEVSARTSKSGLWSHPNPTEPGAWRRGENNPNLDGVPAGSIIGNTNSMIYHTPGCSTYARVSPQNRVTFSTEKEAIEKGYRISGGCESALPKGTVPKVATENTPRKYLKGSRGGCYYYLTPSNKKMYVDKRFCEQ